MAAWQCDSAFVRHLYRIVLAVIVLWAAFWLLIVVTNGIHYASGNDNDCPLIENPLHGQPELVHTTCHEDDDIFLPLFAGIGIAPLVVLIGVRLMAAFARSPTLTRLYKPWSQTRPLSK